MDGHEAFGQVDPLCVSHTSLASDLDLRHLTPRKSQGHRRSGAKGNGRWFSGLLSLASRHVALTVKASQTLSIDHSR